MKKLNEKAKKISAYSSVKWQCVSPYLPSWQLAADRLSEWPCAVKDKHNNAPIMRKFFSIFRSYREISGIKIFGINLIGINIFGGIRALLQSTLYF